MGLYKSFSFLFISTILFFSLAIELIIYTNNYWYLAIPFIWLAIPFLFSYSINFTEQLFWLMIIFLPLSTELNVTETLGLDFPDEVLLMLLTGFFIVKWLYDPSVFPKSLFKSSLFLIIIIHLFWIFLTCLVSTNSILSAKYFLAKWWYIIPFVVFPQIVIRSKSNLSKLAICLLLPMLFVVVQTVIRHSFYQFSFEGIKQTLYPFFRNHVNYSGMLACLLVVGWFMKKLMYVKNNVYNIFNYLLGLGLIALVLSYSRGAWLALIVGIISGFLIYKKWFKYFLFSVIVFIGIAIVWLVNNNNYLQFIPDHDRTVFHTNFNEHLKATITLQDVSNAERFYRWVAGFNMVAQKPIAGFGPNTFYENYQLYSEGIFKTWVSNNPDHSTVHNYFLLIAIEQGIVGLIIFLCLVVVAFMQIEKLYHQFQSNFYRLVTLSLGIILVIIMVLNFLSDLIETDKIGSLFWLVIALVIWLNEQYKIERNSIAVV